MPTYLIVSRVAAGRGPGPNILMRWADWFHELGDHVIDRGNLVFAREIIGQDVESTVLGGYTIVTAADLEEAQWLAKTCPVLDEAGGVEVGELTALHPGAGPS